MTNLTRDELERAVKETSGPRGKYVISEGIMRIAILNLLAAGYTLTPPPNGQRFLKAFRERRESKP